MNTWWILQGDKVYRTYEELVLFVNNRDITGAASSA